MSFAAKIYYNIFLYFFFKETKKKKIFKYKKN